MNRRLLPVTAITAALALSLAGCATSSNADGKGSTTIPVVASTNVWGDIASTVGGNRVSVSSVISDPSKDPHEYQADAQTQLKLSHARVVIENGGGYDDFIDTMMRSLPEHPVTKLNAVAISGKKPDSAGDLNEHVWYDFPTVLRVIDKIEAAYIAVDPSGRSLFQKNAATLESKVRTLETSAANVGSLYHGDAVAITEPVPLYLLDAMGLENKTPEPFSKAIEDSTDVPPSVLHETLALFSSHQVKLLAYNAQTTGPQTQAVLDAAKASSVPIVPVTETLPAGKDYVSWMNDTINAIAAALRG